MTPRGDDLPTPGPVVSPGGAVTGSGAAAASQLPRDRVWGRAERPSRADRPRTGPRSALREAPRTGGQLGRPVLTRCRAETHTGNVCWDSAYRWKRCILHIMHFNPALFL